MITTLDRMQRDRLIARRKLLGFTQHTLALAVGCDRNTAARWERGESEVSAHHREPLARALQWSLTELDDALNGAGRLPVTVGGWFTNYETLEQSATTVRSWEPMVVPGLLQTRAYATALLGDSDRVTRRMDRQRMLTRPGNPVDLVAIVDESVLMRPVGGRDVFAAQLGHLVDMSERGNVTVQVLPLRAHVDAIANGSRGAFVMLAFPWPGGLVHLEHAQGARGLDSQPELEAHIRVFDQLREMALTPNDSTERINAATGELRS